MKVHHINCVKIESPFGPAIGHCLLLAENERLTMVDCGIGMSETKNPDDRLGKELVEKTGYLLDEEITAIKQIEKLGYEPNKVQNIICSHLDPDHIGGLVDFPYAKVHVSEEEYKSFTIGHERYLPQQLAHDPEIRTYKNNDSECLGLPSRRLNLDFEIEIYLVPLFGHTLGHCGVAFKINGKWTFYIGDAYYYRAELTHNNHPVDQLATMAAIDDNLRRESLEKVKQLTEKYKDEINYFGYHDPQEFEESLGSF